MNTYITALTESLEKKLGILQEIRLKNAEQEMLLKEDSFSFDRFDLNTEEKGVLIHRLNSLDDGFEAVYEKVREELSTNKAKYAKEIKHMQELISKITETSASIQAEEARNKAALEQIFKSEREKIRGNRSGVKAVKSYTQAMNYKI